MYNIYKYIMSTLHLLHVLAGLYLLFISIKQPVHVVFYYIILVVALYALLYHAYNFIITLQILYLFHLIIIIPILLTVGILQSKTPEYIFDILLFIAFGTIGFHGYKLIKNQLNIYHGSLIAIILLILFV
jgi:hypothetical protein